MSDDLADRVTRFFWWHSIDLGQGIITPGGKSLALQEQESAAFFDRVDLTGCSVLDIGAWNGFYSFEAKRRGAGRVLATDSYCWSDDRFKGREAFDLAREALGADVEAQEIDVADIKPETTGAFDIVLFLGVFYHRYDPIEALARAASVAKELLIVESHIDLQTLDRPAMAFYPGNELLDDATNWWGPNLPCLQALLRGHGFSEIEIAFHPQTQNRAVLHAWRSTRLRRAPLAAPVQLTSESAVSGAPTQSSRTSSENPAGDSAPDRGQSQLGEFSMLLNKSNPEHRGMPVDVGAHPRRDSSSYNPNPGASPASTLDSGNVMQKIVDPAEYVQKFCEEIGAPVVRSNMAAETGIKQHGKRRLFLRMYQYKGRPFVVRAYERILGRHPEPEEIQSAQSAFFEGRHSRTSLMLSLRFGEEGRLASSCNLVGLSALRVLWNVMHGRKRQIAPLAKER
ncbi:MAG TPA: DUF1698 domain-containing protein [Xanthobacteraceae bacterium]|jgi:tRNA (mo5U34)-methyltransferase|nr:DUF1698 domain-containing protein [Xanthobacteraceae bacterium]